MAKMQKIIVLSGSADLDSHREFFTDQTQICEQPFAVFRQPAPPASERQLYPIGDLGWKLAMDLMKMEGIQVVFLRSASVKITKSFTHSWKDLQPQIFTVLEAHLGQLETAEDYGFLTENVGEMTGATA